MCALIILLIVLNRVCFVGKYDGYELGNHTFLDKSIYMSMGIYIYIRASVGILYIYIYDICIYIYTIV